ncbi:hypothetical protein LTR92_003846 [Exophiala xenobiotica]|nr:hypothetical protein LTR92_003846 [Exophiala xenobiotica]KAK5249807.1 hypothetical protein LTS06_005303 [Exophiala xenobiotica]KAK5369067.1 hypothetical protein LTR11_007439 [Exophiala xenobiotica]
MSSTASTSNIEGAVSQHIPPPPEQPPRTTLNQSQKSSRVCRFYNTSKGCRAGSQCPYRHVQPKDQTQIAANPSDTPSSFESQTLPERPKATLSKPVPSQKPTSQLQQTNPREFQVGQLTKRFSPTRKELEGSTVLSLTLKPSDPDFPFELEGLHCDLTIPVAYPSSGRPSIRVTNEGMPRGYQINVERGFDSLLDQAPGKTLLALMNDLDRNLERFLTSEKAQTIKIISNAGQKEKAPESAQRLPFNPIPVSAPLSLAPETPSWTSQQKSDAQAKRQSDLRQLEARMGRLPNFSKNADGTLFTIPVQIPKPGRLPSGLQQLKEVALAVPKLYNLEPCTVQLKGVSGIEVENIQMAFEKYARAHPATTLMAHINHLTQNIHSMASEAAGQTAPLPVFQAPPENTQSDREKAIFADADAGSEGEGKVVDPDRPHLKFITRPPEWDQGTDSEGDSDSSYGSDDYTESGSEEEEDQTSEGGAALPASSAPSEKGIHLSFPGLELYNVELLTLTSLSLSVKCLRCKIPLDIHNVKATNPAQSSTVSTRTESCSKCTTPFTISFIPNHLHANTIRAGTIDITGCTITDLLPSVFQPTCSSCSSTFPTPPGMISVRDDKPIQVCRSCHAKMSFTIPEVKFLRVSHDSAALPLRRPKKENLGISAGTSLPDNGTCQHYRHSYRWFRFGCCGRVYQCDRCHDAAESHVNEHADRMVCGWCSREQRFRSDDCGICGRSVIRRRKAAGGFWEGGQGTREKRLMSRKEKRKYKRPPGSVPGKKAGAGK